MASKFELNNSTPAAPAGRINIVWQSDAAGNVSGNIPEPSAGGAVASVFGRTGAVVATSGDYTAAQVTNAVSVTGSYADPAWITSLDWTKINNKPAIPNQTPWTSHIDGAGFELRSAGKIGIGTASPAHKLEVASNTGISGPVIALRNLYAPSNNCNVRFLAQTGAGQWDIGMDYSGSGGVELNVINNAGARIMSFLQNGNVGIGTASPSSKLSFGDAAGNITSRIALFEGAGSTLFRGIGMANPSAGVYGVGIYAGGDAPTDTNMALFVRDGGNVGIGTAGPLWRLHVAGGRTVLESANDRHALGVTYTVGGPTLWIGTDLNGDFIVSEQSGTEVFRVKTTGRIQANSLPSTNPGAGTKQLWYDPADANRLKYAA